MMLFNDSSEFYFHKLLDGSTIGRFGVLDSLGLTHGVTTLQGFDTALALSAPGDAAMSFASVLGLESAAWLKQTHGAESIVVDSPGLAGDADGLITDTPGLALVGRSADCPLVLVADSSGGAVGMFHAGWRGVTGGMAKEFVREFVARFDVAPARLVACICPSVGMCCYEVGKDVQDSAVAEMGKRALKFFAYRQGKLHFDMQGCIGDQLLRVGLVKQNVHQAGVCTICHEDLFCSYRRQGEVAGRFQAAIAKG
ncbi:MAG: polyphenol oxidase family protein [Phycisphaerales bacterium]|jgi:polyphenol oxidase|nr:polyphenol oxidase family protein [Phycisphaerales bacterium]